MARRKRDAIKTSFNIWSETETRVSALRREEGVQLDDVMNAALELGLSVLERNPRMVAIIATGLHRDTR
jgi:hypothetical protein